jgi:GGDEF domain-containing protein
MPYVSNLDGVSRTAEKIIKALSQPYNIQGNTITLTASAGVGIFPDNGKDAKTLLKNADVALLEAKQANKNTYRISERVNA